MSQIEIQERSEKTLDKARLIASAKRVRRSSVKESKNIWLVGSGNPKTPKTFWCVMWNKELDGFMCDCPAFQFSPDNTCKHILACSLYEGGLA